MLFNAGGLHHLHGVEDIKHLEKVATIFASEVTRSTGEETDLFDVDKGILCLDES